MSYEAITGADQSTDQSTDLCYSWNRKEALSMGGPTRIPGPIGIFLDTFTSIKDGTLCLQRSPVRAFHNDAGDPNQTPGWDSAHLLYVVNALLVASELETREHIALDRCMVPLLQQGYLKQRDFTDITSEYYSSVNDALPYFVQTDSQIITLSADMEKARRLCTQWYELLVRITDMRQLAAWHSSKVLDTQISKKRKLLVDADREYQKSLKIMNEWYKTISDAGEVNKFVDELKSIQKMNDDIQSVISIFKNPAKAAITQFLGQVKSKLSGGADKWDVIKKGITNLGDYLATTELIAYHQTTIMQVLSEFFQATEDIFKHSRRIVEFEQQRTKIELLGEVNPALYGVTEWGMI